MGAEALRGVADELAAVAVAVQTLSSHVTPGTGTAAHFGDAQRRTGWPWSAPAVGEATEREASWQRLRALLGEDAAERPGRGP